MSKAKKNQRPFGEVLAEISDLQERFGQIRRFLRMAEHLIDAVGVEGSARLKAIAAKVKESFLTANEAVEGGAEG